MPACGCLLLLDATGCLSLVLVVLAAAGCSRLLLTVTACSWSPLADCDYCILLLAPSACLWLLLAAPECSWPAHSWLLMAAYGCSSVFLVASACKTGCLALETEALPGRRNPVGTYFPGIELSSNATPFPHPSAPHPLQPPFSTF